MCAAGHSSGDRYVCLNLFGSFVLVSVLTLGFAGCQRVQLPNTPSNLAFGQVRATFSPSEARLLGRNASCPAAQPFLWTHRVELREQGGVGVTVLDWQSVEVSGTSFSSGPTRRSVSTLNQCSVAANDRIAPNQVVCGDVNVCGTAVAPGREIEHRFSVVDDNNVPNTATIRVPLAIQ